MVVDGVGNGHGRGLSQWGSYGWAVNYGWDWTQILDHYYGGTTMGDAAERSHHRAPARPRRPADGRDLRHRNGELVGRIRATTTRSSPGRSAASTRSTARPTPGTSCPPPAEEALAGGVGAARPDRCTAHRRSGRHVHDARRRRPRHRAWRRARGLRRRRHRRSLPRAASTPPTALLARTAPSTPCSSSRTCAVSCHVRVRRAGELAGGGAGANALRAQSVAARSYALTQARYSYAKTCDSSACQVYGGAGWRVSASSTTATSREHELDRRRDRGDGRQGPQLASAARSCRPSSRRPTARAPLAVRSRRSTIRPTASRPTRCTAGPVSSTPTRSPPSSTWAR